MTAVLFFLYWWSKVHCNASVVLSGYFGPYACVRGVWVQVRSFRKAYEGELVALTTSWTWKYGRVPDIARGTWLSQELGSVLMRDVRERTGVPPVCAINGILA